MAITRPASGVAFRGFLALGVLMAGAAPGAERLPVKTYTTENGLPHNVVLRVVRDSTGFVWFCTKDGLARFDGYGFVRFGIDEGLPSGAVNDILETRAGERWVATDNGLARFTPTGRPNNGAPPTASNVTPMFARITSGEPEDRFMKTITVLREGSDGTVWVGTRRGLYRVAGAGPTASLQRVELGLTTDLFEAAEITDIHEDRFRTLWVTTPWGLYRRWPDGSTARYSQGDGFTGHYFQGLIEDHNGRFWAATREAGMISFTADGTHARPVVGATFTEQQGLPNNWVNQILETSDRRFWIATGNGLAEFFEHGDALGQRFHVFGRRNGLADSALQSLAEDFAGNLWIGLNRGGAMKIAGDGFTTYGREDGIANVNAIVQDAAGDLCFRGYMLGDHQGKPFDGARLELAGVEPLLLTRLGCFDGRRFTWFEPAAIRRWGWVLEGTTLHTRRGEFWLGTEEGVFRFAPVDHFADLKDARPLAQYVPGGGLASGQVYRLFEDSAGGVWISMTSSARQGLARWDPQTGQVSDLSNSKGLPSLKDEVARAFAEDTAGDIWIAFGSGLVRYAHGAFMLFGRADGLPGSIRDVHVDRTGRLWLASEDAGLIRVDHGETLRPTFVSYTQAQGLSSNDAEVIVEDAKGFLYTGGGLGIDRFDPNTGRVRHFAAADGLAPGLLSAGFQDRNGVLWFGTSSSLARLRPGHDDAAAPQALISAVRVTGVPQAVSAIGAREVSLGEFAPGQNQVEIDFVALGLAAGEVLRYQYRLEGAAGEWSAPSLLRTVNFGSLAHGQYRFLVRAINANGVMSAEPASVTFTILRPIWLRWWFLTLGGALLAAAVFSIHRYRVARVLELAAIRTRIATDLHDDIGANLTRISLLSEVTAAGADQQSMASNGNIARESAGSMSDIVWAIDPKHESLADLIRRMRRHGEEVFALRDIELTFQAPVAPDGLRLSMDVRRDLLLIFKEAVSNAARHAHCSRVSIDLSIKDSRVVLIVADNGVGFDTAQPSDGQGLASLRRRAQRLNATIDVQSRPQAGTTIVLQVPLSRQHANS